MKKEKTYTLGEVMRLGLIKNHKGEPYRHKASLVKLFPNAKRVPTPFGLGYEIPESEIARLNQRWNV